MEGQFELTPSLHFKGYHLILNMIILSEGAQKGKVGKAYFTIYIYGQSFLGDQSIFVRLEKKKKEWVIPLFCECRNSILINIPLVVYPLRLC